MRPLTAAEIAAAPARLRQAAQDFETQAFAQLLQPLVQLLYLERIADAHGPEEVGSKIRYASELQHLAFGKTVADLHVAVIGQADDVAGIGFLDLLA